jgi:hypothetical protein
MELHKYEHRQKKEIPALSTGPKIINLLPEQPTASL